VDKLKIPRPFLRKILQQLNQQGLLKSSKGQGGGFRLAVSAEKISLVDLMEIFQGDFRLNECLFKKKSCPRQNSCGLKKKIDQIEGKVMRLLEKITLASLLQ
jgi:Rrf2 family protein